MTLPRRLPLKTMTTTTICSALLLLAACRDVTDPTTPQAVGGACAKDADCKEGLACDTRLPGGACTQSCAAVGECPKGSQCINLTYTVSGVEHAEQKCVKECTDLVLCRTGWKCVRADPEPYSVCVP